MGSAWFESVAEAQRRARKRRPDEGQVRPAMIGRAYLWGLAANGQAGVENVLDILRAGLDSALLALGRASVHDLTPDDLVIPAGFTRALGTAAPDIKVT